MTFPTLDMAVEWFASTEEMNAQLERINFEEINRDLDRITFASTSDVVRAPPTIDWLHHYVDHYLRRWGTDMVAVDIRSSAENKNNNLPEDHRLEIPTDVTGTAVGCRRTNVFTID